jgi:hypothetical protein
MHEKLPMAAYPSLAVRDAAPLRRGLGRPALLILLGALLAYGGGVVRDASDGQGTPAPVSAATTTSPAAIFAQ